jgi:uncharacterized protein YifE (UPF0438 family)
MNPARTLTFSDIPLPDVHNTPRTVAPLSNQTTRSPAMSRPRTIDFDSVPSPRTNRNPDFRNSTYSGRASTLGGFRNIAGPPEDLGDIDPDAYIDYTGGAQDQPSSPLAVISPPPALGRESPISPPRSPTPKRFARSPVRDATPRARDSTVLRPTNGATDEYRASRESPKAGKGQSSRLKARGSEPVDEEYDAPDPLDMGEAYDYEEGHDMDGDNAIRDREPLEDHNRDRRNPTKGETEGSEEEEENDVPLAKKKKTPKQKQEKAKAKEPKTAKKRVREDDHENEGQPKKKKAPTSKASSKPRSKAEPKPDLSYFEGKSTNP